MSIKVAPSLLSADFANMERDIKTVEQAGADYLHCDIMDGVFVPNITFGPKMVADIKKHTKLPLDVHLMIIQPQKYIEAFTKAGADMLTIHVETVHDPVSVIKQIKNLGIFAGAVINPNTPVETLEGVLEHCDLVLLMSVEPGFGGQKFIPHVLDKIKKVRKMIDQIGKNIGLEVDGGITVENIGEVLSAGADMIVAGSTVFGAADKAAVIKKLRGE